MAVSVDDDADADEWVHDAFLDPRVAAAVLLGFHRRSRLQPEAEGDERPSTSTAAELREWGRRIKRSRVLRLPRIVPATREEEEEEAAAAEKRKGKRRASPQSPLEGYSSASASGGEDGTSSTEKPAKAPRPPCLATAAAPEDRRTKAFAKPRAPSVSLIPASGSIRRPASRKMTKPELEAAERTLLDERAKLRKEMEELRRAVEELRADNRKLEISMQMHLELPKVPITAHMVLEDVQLPGSCQPITLSSSLLGRKDFIAIPDLNDPLPDC